MKDRVNVISKDHALAGAEEGFVQASHGKGAALQALNRGDLIFFYSPGTHFRKGTILQAFTAVARVTDDEPHQVETPGNVFSWRRNTTFLPCGEAAIEPLLPHLAFIPDRAHWEASLRRGMFEIGRDDARRIAEAMKADIAR